MVGLGVKNPPKYQEPDRHLCISLQGAFLTLKDDNRWSGHAICAYSADNTDVLTICIVL